MNENDGLLPLNDERVSERTRRRFAHFRDMGMFADMLRELRAARAFVTSADMQHETAACREWFRLRHEHPHPHDDQPAQEREHLRFGGTE